MTDLALSHRLLPESVPAVLVLLVAVLALGLWVRLRLRRRMDRSRRARWTALAGRVALCGLGLLASAEAMQRIVTFATPWPVWLLMVGGGLLAEGILVVSAAERRTVPRRTGRVVAALRLSLLMLLLLTLCQPVRVVTFPRRVQRQVAVLLDVSRSMQVPDSGLTVAERVRLAECLAPADVKRPIRLDRAAALLRRGAGTLSLAAEPLAQLARTNAVAAPADLRAALRRFVPVLAAAGTSAGSVRRALEEAAGSDLAKTGAFRAAEATEAQARLGADVQAPLAACTRLTDAAGKTAAADAPARAREALSQAGLAVVGMNGLATSLDALADRVDEAFGRTLTNAARAGVEAVAALPRAEVARRLLSAPTGAGAATDWLERVGRVYGLSCHVFAGGGAACTPEGLRTNSLPRLAAGTGEDRTDLAGALDRVLADIPAEQLAGILLLSDGRHNAARPVEPAASRLGLVPAPVFALPAGGAHQPPTDLAVRIVEAPDIVYPGDRVSIRADIALQGLPRTNVWVNILEEGVAVGSNAIEVASAAQRVRTQFVAPAGSNGLHRFRIELPRLPEEATWANNAADVPVYVAAHRTRLLLLDGGPRWEFRYLKNLFTGRDTSVTLQYVLFDPDRIEGAPAVPPRPALATREDDPEATALPENPDEWLKFDVVILGDVPPSALPAGAQVALRRFVAERGGALVAIAGPLHMPHAYVNQPLADLLPVTFDPATKAMLGSPEPEFRFVLTAEGRGHPLLALADDPAASARVWAELPAFHWRHAIRAPKPGASVLAYAMPWGGAVVDGTDGEAEGTAAGRRALAVTQRVGAGRVLFLATDRTWRLRYRHGDRYHHRFWGQVMRWATGERLPAGTENLRVGTDRQRYDPRAPVRVLARVSRADLYPVEGASLRVRIVGDAAGEAVTRKMAEVADARGLYEAVVDALPAGAYRAEVEVVKADGLPANQPDRVATAFVVAEAASPEYDELSVDRGLLGRVADLSGGRLLDPADLADPAALFGPAQLTVRERRQYDLWSSWPWFAFLVLVAAVEWVMRKRARLP